MFVATTYFNNVLHQSWLSLIAGVNKNFGIRNLLFDRLILGRRTHGPPPIH
jgi:hypothetical protein